MRAQAARLAEQVEAAYEALALHEKMARDLWASALKGPAAVRFMRTMIEKSSAPA